MTSSTLYVDAWISRTETLFTCNRNDEAGQKRLNFYRPVELPGAWRLAVRNAGDA
jgi:hypothetical protein